MSIIGSSSILADGSTGSIGPIGPRGNTGNTGPDATGCGELTKGNTASYISSVTQTKNPWGNLIFGLNDGSTVEFNAPSIIGATLSSFYGVRAITLGSNSLFAGITQTTAGLTFQFKTITSSVGALSVKTTSDQIIFTSSSTPYNATGFTSAELVYFSSITGSDRLAGITLAGSTFFRYKNNNYFDLNTVISSKTNIVHIPSAARGSSGQYIDVSSGGLFYINTPNGIMGFTGISGAPGTTGTIQSITLITKSDYIWKFPENVWFEAGNNYLGCGETVIGLTTKNNGENWTATIFGRGYKASPITCQSDWDIGSCYDTTGISCNNYVYRADCKAAGGLFCLESCSIETEIFDEGSCCANGVCRDGVSKFLCTKYGGRWWSPEQTGSSGCNAFECWDPCSNTTGSCCVGATCLDRYTESECDMLNGTWTNKSCSDSSCNPFSGITGACCVNKDICLQTTYQTCIDVLEGIFVGIGETCGDVNCDCFTYKSSAIGCNSSISKSGSGVAFSEQTIDLSSLTWTKSAEGVSQGSFCFSYTPYNIPDRWLILKTKDSDSSKQNLIRGSEDARYKSNYKTFVLEPEHPWYSDGISYTPAILFDTRCIRAPAGTVSAAFRKTVTVTENDVEITDPTDLWYKKIRLWNLAGCSAGKQQATAWQIGISCGDCPTTPEPSTQLPSINNAISIKQYINSNVTYTLWQPNYASPKTLSDISSPKYSNSSTTNPPKTGY